MNLAIDRVISIFVSDSHTSCLIWNQIKYFFCSPSHEIHLTMHSNLSILALAGLASAYLGEICGGPSVGYGTCEETAKWCEPRGGESPPNYCPDDVSSIRCCIYPICYNKDYYNGKCVDTSEYNCASIGGYLQSGLCPGPDNYEVG
jgi:hypothetical protein